MFFLVINVPNSRFNSLSSLHFLFKLKVSELQLLRLIQYLKIFFKLLFFCHFETQNAADGFLGKNDMKHRKIDK